MKKQKMPVLTKALPFVLAVMLVVTLCPAFGGSVSAAEGDQVEVEEMDDIALGEIDPEMLDLEEMDLAEDSVDAEVPEQIETPVEAEQAETEVSEETIAAAEEALQGENVRPETVDEGLLENGQLTKKGAVATEGIKLTPNNSTGILHVEGKVTGGDSFTGIGVFQYDPNTVLKMIAYEAIEGTSFTRDLKMYELPVGEYLIAANTTNKNKFYTEPTKTLIYSAPANAASNYETYSKYLFYNPPGTFRYPKDTTCGLYLDIRKVGTSTWKTYGPITSQSQITGLKAKKKYQCKVYYGKSTKDLDGKTIFISGKNNGKFRTVTVKTARGKLPIKSVKVKAVNVKKHTHKRYGPATGLYLGKETWYTYRLKITVKLKKKAGIKGLYINGKRVKGNKKTYSVKLPKTNTMLTGKHVVKHYSKWWKQDDTYKLPRGKKFKVFIYSYSNNTYKAYSPMQSKKPKIK